MRSGFFGLAVLLVSVFSTPLFPQGYRIPRGGRAFGQEISIPGIKDAGKINDYLYRGSQPNEHGLEELKKLGVTVVVDLRGEFFGRSGREQQGVEKLGMRFVLVPGNGWSPPTDEQIAKYFALISERPRQRVYVHCWFGEDRTGVFLAAYRIAFDHWTPDDALAEMTAFHFKAFWHPAMIRYIRDFPERLATSAPLAPYRSKANSQFAPAPNPPKNAASNDALAAKTLVLSY